VHSVVTQEVIASYAEKLNVQAVCQRAASGQLLFLGLVVLRCKTHLAGGQIRLDGPGIHAIRALLEDYTSALETLTERAMIQCHRDTEIRIRDILAGRKQPHDVEVINL
jgi:hypothetical protein